YNSADPGPAHACATGGLASTAFDNDTTQNGTNTSFELLPAGSTYTCISQNGSSTGQLTWNGTSSTWNGVPAKTLVVNGRVVFDDDVREERSHDRRADQHRQVRQLVQQRVVHSAAGDHEHAGGCAASAEHGRLGRHHGHHEVTACCRYVH